MSYQKTYKKWCTDPYFDAQTQEELKTLRGTKKRSRTVSTVSWSLPERQLCLNANGIHTYLFESLRPTPELSFAVRELGCIAGIVITASHNPREYNGYKVYWEDGAQITPPHDKNILAEVAKVTDFSMVKAMEEDEARAENLFSIIGTDFDDKYIAQLKNRASTRRSSRRLPKI